MNLYLVHHGEAVQADVDSRRPLSPRGQHEVDRVAEAAAARGACPEIVWHSGKLRARQTAEAFRRACNPFAQLSATKDLQPHDRPDWMRDRLRGESCDVLIAGHFPHLPRLLAALVGLMDPSGADFPQHGVVALETADDGESWRERWRIGRQA